MFSSPKPKPARLHKVEPTPAYVGIVQRLMPVMIMILIFLVLLLFVKICFAVVPPTDSGLWYNHALNGGL